MAVALIRLACIHSSKQWSIGAGFTGDVPGATDFLRLCSQAVQPKKTVVINAIPTQETVFIVKISLFLVKALARVLILFNLGASQIVPKENHETKLGTTRYLYNRYPSLRWVGCFVVRPGRQRQRTGGDHGGNGRTPPSSDGTRGREEHDDTGPGCRDVRTSLDPLSNAWSTKWPMI